MTAFKVATRQICHTNSISLMKTASPISRNRKSSTIAQNLESDILTEKFQEGDRLPSEDALCDKFSVSRTVIREAIQQLKAKGLLRSIKGSGSFIAVAGYSHLRSSLKFYSALVQGQQPFLELMDLRILLETECVKQAAKLIDARGLQIVETAFNKMRKSGVDFKKLAQADMEFHLEVAHASENKLYDEILSALLPQLGLRYARSTYTDDILEKNLLEHQNILEALKRGDSKGATAWMKKHLTDSRTRFTKLLQ